MQRERVAENIYVFSSDRYLQVTAGIIVTSAGCVVVDTLPFPSESRELLTFARKVCRKGLRYAVNTHYHADHTYGNCFFEGIPIIAHELTRKMLIKVGDSALQEAREENPELETVWIRPPDMVYLGKATLRLGEYSIELIHAPGNSPDGTCVYINEEKVLFAGDVVLPVPYIVDGDLDALEATLTFLRSLSVESLVQGHGEVLLRGEVPEAIDASVNYLKRLREYVQDAIHRDFSQRELLSWDIEEAGLSRIPLGGVVRDLHRANLLSLFEKMKQAEGRQMKAPAC